MTRVIRGQHITNISAPGPPIENVHSIKSDQGGPKHNLSPKKVNFIIGNLNCVNIWRSET